MSTQPVVHSLGLHPPLEFQSWYRAIHEVLRSTGKSYAEGERKLRRDRAAAAGVGRRALGLGWGLGLG